MEKIKINQSDDGRVVTVAPGQEVVVRLPENPATGYRWEPPVEVKVIADEYLLPSGTAMGGGGERKFTLGALAMMGELRFELKRPGGEPESTFTLRLIHGD